MNLTKSSKILSITHNDMDGIGCQIVLSNYFTNITYSVATYSNIDDILKKTLENQDRYDYIFVTDIHPEDDSILDRFKNLILLDHHDSALDLHDPSKNLFVIPEICGTKLTRNYLRTKFNVDLDHLDDMINVINDYDLWIHNDTRSKDLNEIFYKYWGTRFRRRFNDGKLIFTNEEQNYIDDRKKEFNQIYNDLNLYELEKIKGVFVQAKDFINEISDKLQVEDGYYIVIVRNLKGNGFSVRSNKEWIHIGNMLDKLGIGGGHADAGGCNKKLDNIQENIELISNYIYENYQQMRK